MTTQEHKPTVSAIQAEMLTDLDRFAEAMFDPNGQIMQTFVGIGPKGERHIIAAPWRDAADRRAILLNIRLFFAQKGITAYGFISEAWAATYTKDSDLNVLPADRPDRKEIITMIACAEGCEPAGQQREIIRTADGSGHLGPIETVGDYDGAICSLLPGAVAVQRASQITH